MKSVSVIIILVACYLSVEFSVAQAAANRERRETKEDIQKKIKEYAESIGKSPEDAKAAVAKLMQDQELNILQVQQALMQGGDKGKQMMEKIKKAIAG